MKMLRLSISGSFRTEIATDKHRKNYDLITIDIPYCDEEWYIVNSHRLFPICIKKNKKYSNVNFEGVIKIYIDDVQEIEGKIPCIGKDIKLMTWEELQYLACYYQIIEIPLYRKNSLRYTREKAYEMYQLRVLKKNILYDMEAVLRFREDIKTEGERRRLSESEIQNEFESRISNAFCMVSDPEVDVYTNQPIIEPYNFMKLPSLIIPDPDSKITISN